MYNYLSLFYLLKSNNIKIEICNKNKKQYKYKYMINI